MTNCDGIMDGSEFLWARLFMNKNARKVGCKAHRLARTHLHEENAKRVNNRKIIAASNAANERWMGNNWVDNRQWAQSAASARHCHRANKTIRFPRNSHKQIRTRNYARKFYLDFDPENSSSRVRVASTWRRNHRNWDVRLALITA